MRYALEVLKTGSGASADNPVRLGRVNNMLASCVESAVVSVLFGPQNWTGVERRYHRNGRVFEWRIRRVSGQVLPVFFDISQLSLTAPVSEEVRQEFNKHADNIPVPNTTLISRFPLIKMEARSAAEAADFISSHLVRAAGDGWEIGQKIALADGWRNDYYLTRGNETTTMSFDMRPCLMLNHLELTMLSLAAGPQVDENFAKQRPTQLVRRREQHLGPPSSPRARDQRIGKWVFWIAVVFAAPIIIIVVLTIAEALLKAHG